MLQSNTDAVSIVQLCTVVNGVVTDCKQWVADYYVGWYFESTDSVCHFPSPVPAWLFEIHDWLSAALLWFLCGGQTA